MTPSRYCSTAVKLVKLAHTDVEIVIINLYFLSQSKDNKLFLAFKKISLQPKLYQKSKFYNFLLNSFIFIIDIH